MAVSPLVVRPRLGERVGHDLVDAEGTVVAHLDVAVSRDTGAIVVDGRRWPVRRPPGGRDWRVTAAAFDAPGDAPASPADTVATITKPSAIRERFVLTIATETFAIEPRGPIGRRRWEVRGDGTQLIEVTQGLVRRRWHELAPAGDAPQGAAWLPVGDDDAASTLTLVVAFVVALVDTTPPTGLGGLRRANG